MDTVVGRWRRTGQCEVDKMLYFQAHGTIQAHGTQFRHQSTCCVLGGRDAGIGHAEIVLASLSEAARKKNVQLHTSLCEAAKKKTMHARLCEAAKNKTMQQYTSPALTPDSL